MALAPLPRVPRALAGLALASVTPVALAALAACGSAQEQRLAPVIMAPAAAAAPSAAPPVAAARTPAPPEQEEPDPGARSFFLAHLAAPPVAPSAAPPSKVALMALESTVLGEASAMDPAEGLASASLGEGQRIALPVTIAAGGCATFVAQGGLGAVEVDLFLTQGAGGSASPKILAEDPTTGPAAVIGGRRGCIAPGAAFTGELSAVLRRGAGVVMVRGFRKP
jgi:hypothetical protein